jgi:hypothetical protein
MSVENFLLRPSILLAAFTVSEMTVESMRLFSPMVPSMRGPEWIPMPKRIGT